MSLCKVSRTNIFKWYDVSLADGSLESPQGSHSTAATLRALAGSPRLLVYAACSVLALLTGYLLGKDVMWDTVSYHLYDGFTALHDRFDLDYFAAGTQSYFNPYIYAPYYLLARSGLSALGVSSILALVQSGILWLTYELAIQVSPAESRAARTAFPICATALAFANPILIDQIGTSYVDIITAEVVLAAWLLLIAAVRRPGMTRIACAGLLLGAVSALKLTNSVHAVAACAILPFVPVGLKARARYAAVFAAAGAISFLIVMTPWSLHLERHFGNPVFPLFNGWFRSPQFPIASLQDHRFIPDSLVDGLLRPFAIAAPVTMTDDEFAAPDLRYVVLLVLAAALVVRWFWLKWVRHERLAAAPQSISCRRAFIALGCGFLVDWILWLTAAGIGRYFIAAACVAAVLCVGLAFRLFAMRPKAGACVLAAVLAAQIFEMCVGATYRSYVPWDGGRPFELSIPEELTARPYLYLTLGEQSLSFVAPFVAPGSGFVDLEGDYVIGPSGPNGAHLESLIRRYGPYLRVLVADPRFTIGRGAGLPDRAHIDDTLAHFGLRADEDDCSTILFKDVRQPFIDVLPGTLPIHLPQLQGRKIRVPVSPDRTLTTCKVVPDDRPEAALFASEGTANLAFDHLEDECPQLFQPRRPVTEDYGDEKKGYYWIRRYDTTDLAVIITHGVVKLVDPVRGGPATYLGHESDWETEPLQLACGRRDGRYYANIAHPMGPSAN